MQKEVYREIWIGQQAHSLFALNMSPYNKVFIPTHLKML